MRMLYIQNKPDLAMKIFMDEVNFESIDKKKLIVWFFKEFQRYIPWFRFSTYTFE